MKKNCFYTYNEHSIGGQQPTLRLTNYLKIWSDNHILIFWRKNSGRPNESFYSY